MIEFVAKTAKLAVDGAGLWLHVLAGREAEQSVKTLLDEMDGGTPYVFRVQRRRNRRSMDANAYAWVLLDRLAAKTGVPSRNIYRELIRDVGGNQYMVSVREEAAEAYIRHWQHNGIGWIAEVLGPGEQAGYVDIIAWYGSSEYDMAQMSRLIDLIVAECREQGIETIPPDQLSALVDMWGHRV